MGRAMHRHEVPVGTAYPFTLVVGNEIARVECTAHTDVVEFWIEHEDDRTMSTRWFQVFGTGQTLPDNGRWVGTTARHASGIVWHLFEVVKP